MNCWKVDRREVNKEEIDAAWLKKIAETTTHCEDKNTPSRQQSLQNLWSPSMETPKTGVSSIDLRLREVSVTSPTLLFGNSAAGRLALSEEEDGEEIPSTNLTNPIEFSSAGEERLSTAIGFTTAAGKRVKSPSKEAIQRNKAVILSGTMDADNDGQPETLGGFTTGSGKKLEQPSEASMLRARKIINQQKEKPTNPTSSRLQAIVEEDARGSIRWKNALKCAPCRDIDMAILSGVYVFLIHH
jgi:hypothetical protein